MPITKDWNVTMGMTRAEMMVFPQKMLDTISISWPIRCPILYLVLLLILSVVFCVMACYIFKFWSRHLFSTCPLALSQGNAPRVPDCVPRAVLSVDPQETGTCHQKLLGQETGDSARLEAEK